MRKTAITALLLLISLNSYSQSLTIGSIPDSLKWYSLLNVSVTHTWKDTPISRFKPAVSYQEVMVGMYRMDKPGLRWINIKTDSIKMKIYYTGTIDSVFYNGETYIIEKSKQ